MLPEIKRKNEKEGEREGVSERVKHKWNYDYTMGKVFNNQLIFPCTFCSATLSYSRLRGDV